MRYKNTKPRLKGHDYSQPGHYFITMVTKNRKCIFGKIQDHQMIYSTMGEIAKEEWLRSFEIRSEMICKNWVIMPNHIHAIVTITKYPDSNLQRILNTGIAFRAPRSVSSFVAGFKSSVTTRINTYYNTAGNPIWQERFHDHIIRDENAYHKIRNYIENNPRMWNNDVFYPQAAQPCDDP
jgi:putative transposase